MHADTRLRSLQRLFHLRRSGSGFKSSRYLPRWLPISVAIRLVAGVGALAFFAAIHFSIQWLLEELVGYLPLIPWARDQ